jgi:hypothetical protein
VQQTASLFDGLGSLHSYREAVWKTAARPFRHPHPTAHTHCFDAAKPELHPIHVASPSATDGVPRGERKRSMYSADVDLGASSQRGIRAYLR